MDSKTQCMRFVGYYLSGWIVVLVLILFWLWPRLPIDPQQVVDSNTPTVSIPEPNDVNNVVETSAKTEKLDPESLVSGSKDSSILKQCPIWGWKFVGLVVIIGILGACLHGMTSLVYHIGMDDFEEKWAPWYLCRPVVGGVLALIFYLIINAGLISHVEDDEKRFFWILGLSGLIGLFSKQALNKLSMIFDAVFASDKERDEKTQKKPKPPDNPPEPNEQEETPPEENQS